MEQIIPEPCTWDPEFGFQHQHFCNHTCHSNITGFGHIFICCGRMIVGGDIRCSSRCQRRHGTKASTESAVDPPDCPHCGPWSEEGRLYTSLCAVEWWFHLFALLPLTDEVKFRILQLRLHLVEILSGMTDRWQVVYRETDSVHALRSAIKTEWERQRDSFDDDDDDDGVAKPVLDSADHASALPCSVAEAENWYVPETAMVCSPGAFALDSFLDVRAGALDFSTEGDADGELRLDMIAHINYGLSTFAWPPETEMNCRRLLTLFDRDLFTNHVLQVGIESVPEICESDRQVLIHRGEGIVAASKGYWTSLEDLAGCQNAYEMSRDELEKAFGWLVGSSTLAVLEPIFSWLEMAAKGEVRFKTGAAAFRGFTYGSAKELLKQQEALPSFSGLLFWTSGHVETFLNVAEEARDRRPRSYTGGLAGLWGPMMSRRARSNEV